MLNVVPCFIVNGYISGWVVRESLMADVIIADLLVKNHTNLKEVKACFVKTKIIS